MSVEQEIRDWYAGLPEITLPNLDSPDGTHMEINLPELVKFIDKLLTASNREARIDELKLLQLSEDIPDDVKDVCYYPHIKNRIAELKKGKSE